MGYGGDLFSLVLKEKAEDLDFNQTATLHYQQAYFNATLLGKIFRRMGLPPESLDFLTRGAKMTKPSLFSTLSNLPGLLRLFKKEWNLEKDFYQDYHATFKPQLEQFKNQNIKDLSPQQLLQQIETILLLLKSATYYSILAPLSLGLRQAILKVSPDQLNNNGTPEIAALKALETLADQAHCLFNKEKLDNHQDLFSILEMTPSGQKIIKELNDIIETYGYLSDVATDISVPCWGDDPELVKNLFVQLTINRNESNNNVKKYQNDWKTAQVQKRLDLKGKVTEVYSQFLAQLRWSFLGLSNYLIDKDITDKSQDIFELTYAEIRKVIQSIDKNDKPKLKKLIEQRQQNFKTNQALKNIPYIVYGNIPSIIEQNSPMLVNSNHKLQGIGASSGIVQGYIKICHNFQQITDLGKDTILVVPYVDSGWGPLLARASGIIAEVGGALSHGAIIAREYGIPAVMSIDHATELFKEGQRVKIDGQQGTIEILEN